MSSPSVYVVHLSIGVLGELILKQLLIMDIDPIMLRPLDTIDNVLHDDILIIVGWVGRCQGRLHQG
jgi:hypothetical protein